LAGFREIGADLFESTTASLIFSPSLLIAGGLSSACVTRTKLSPAASRPSALPLPCQLKTYPPQPKMESKCTSASKLAGAPSLGADLDWACWAEPPTRMLPSGRTSTASASPSLQRAGEEHTEVFDPCGHWVARDQPKRFVQLVRSFIEADDKKTTPRMISAPNWLICVRHEAHCYIARIAGMDWRRCLWI
jgi:pimeloyl-ACP methyl ester carboxylesterase